MSSDGVDTGRPDIEILPWSPKPNPIIRSLPAMASCAVAALVLTTPTLFIWIASRVTSGPTPVRVPLIPSSSSQMHFPSAVIVVFLLWFVMFLGLGGFVLPRVRSSFARRRPEPAADPDGLRHDEASEVARRARWEGIRRRLPGSFDISEYQRLAIVSNPKPALLVRGDPGEGPSALLGRLGALRVGSGFGGTHEEESIRVFRDRRARRAAFLTLGVPVALWPVFLLTSLSSRSGFTLSAIDAFPLFVAAVFLSFEWPRLFPVPLDLSDTLSRPGRVEFISPFRPVCFAPDQDLAIIEGFDALGASVVFLKPSGTMRYIRLDPYGLAKLLHDWRPEYVEDDPTTPTPRPPRSPH